MLGSLIDTFVNLDDKNKNKVLEIISNVINPIKIYLIVVILILLLICISNYYVYRKLNEIVKIFSNNNLVSNALSSSTVV